MIVRFQRCVGIRLLRVFRWQLEVWFCPSGEIIPAHSHSRFDSRLIHLFGSMIWTMSGKSRFVSYKDFGWSRRVPAGVDHGAVALSPALFANLERWSGSPTSAAVDFQPAA